MRIKSLLVVTGVLGLLTGASAQMESGPSDLEIEIGYQPLTFYYTYRAVHPNSGMVIASGKLVALDGPDAGRKIANEVISRVKKLRGPEQPEKAEAKTEKKS
jgi:hypothetical protein